MRTLWMALSASMVVTACNCQSKATTQVQPDISASAQVIDFGDVPVGSSVSKQLDLTNTGRAPLTFSAFGTASPFSVPVPVLTPLGAGEVSSLRVWFSHSSSGPAEGTLTIESDAATTPKLTVTLRGNGVACSASCEAPPPGHCVDTQTFAGYSAPGTCTAGACEYTEVRTTCAGGCANGLCQPEPCSGVTCNAPPACHGSGVCQDGACRYTVTPGASCDDGDACTGSDVCDPSGACSGTAVSCQSPPAPECASSSDLRTFSASGTCASDAGCSYAFTDSPCPVPPNGAAAFCSEGTCGFFCVSPLVRCGNGCCDPSARLTTGSEMSCAITLGGTLKCWGSNQYGQAGIGSAAARTPVAAVALGSNVSLVSASQRSACALTTDGAVYCWGDDSVGQLGNGGPDGGNPNPVLVSGLGSGQVQVSCGTFHCCALSNAGTVSCWGLDQSGEFGRGAAGGPTASFGTPLGMPLDAGATIVAASDGDTFVRLAGGVVMGCGYNQRGEAGVGAGPGPVPTPTTIPALNNARSLSAHVDGAHACGIVSDGGVMCWGYNFYGQVGDGTRTNRTAPVAVLGLSGPARSISVASRHTCAIIVDGGLECWGANDYGQIGDGTKSPDRISPVHVALDAGVIAVSGEWSHTCALLENETVQCWGSNFDGETNPNAVGTEQLTPVMVQGF